MASLISLPLSFLRRISRMRIPGLARGIVAPSLPATWHAQSAQDNEVRSTPASRQSGTPTRWLRISGYSAILAAGCLAMQGAFAHSASTVTDHHDSADSTKSQPYGFADAFPTADDRAPNPAVQNRGWGWGVRATGTIIKNHWDGSGLDGIYVKDGVVSLSTSSDRPSANPPTGFNEAKSFSSCVWDSATTAGNNKASKVSRFYISGPRPNSSDPDIGARFDWNAAGGGNGQFEGLFAFSNTSEMDLAFRLDDGHDWQEDDKLVLRCYLDQPSSWVLAIMVQVGERLEASSAHEVVFSHNDSANNFTKAVDVTYPTDDQRGVGIGDGQWRIVAAGDQHQSTRYIKGLNGFSIDNTNSVAKAVVTYYRKSPPGLYSVYNAFHDHNQGAVTGATTFIITNVAGSGALTVTNSGVKVGESDHPIIEHSTFYSLVTIDMHPSNHNPEFRKAPGDRTDTNIVDTANNPPTKWLQLQQQAVKVARVEGALVNATKKSIYVDNIQYEEGVYASDGTYTRRSNAVDPDNNHLNIQRCSVRGPGFKHRDIKGFFMADDRQSGGQHRRGSYFVQQVASGMEAGGQFTITANPNSQSGTIARHASGNNTDLIFRLDDDHTFRNGDKIKIWCFDSSDYGEDRISVEFNITVRDLTVEEIPALTLKGSVHHDFSQYIDVNGLRSETTFSGLDQLTDCGDDAVLNLSVDNNVLIGQCPGGLTDENLTINVALKQWENAVIGATVSSNNRHPNYSHSNDTASVDAVSATDASGQDLNDTPAVRDAVITKTITLTIPSTRLGTGDGSLVGNSIYLKSVSYNPANAGATSFPRHQFCDIISGGTSGIKHFYLANARNSGTVKRGVLYIRDNAMTGNSNRFIPVSSDRNTSDPVWGMNTTGTELLIRLEDDHSYSTKTSIYFQCGSGSLTDASPDDISEYFAFDINPFRFSLPAGDQSQIAFEKSDYRYTLNPLAADLSGQNGAFFSLSTEKGSTQDSLSLDHTVGNDGSVTLTSSAFTANQVGTHTVILVYKDDQTSCVDDNEASVSCTDDDAMTRPPVYGATWSLDSNDPNTSGNDNQRQSNDEFSFVNEGSSVADDNEVGGSDHPEEGEGVVRIEFTLRVFDFATGEQAALCSDDNGSPNFDQRVVNRTVYAREIFRTDGSDRVIIPPPHDMPRFVLTSRLTFTGLSRGEVSLNLNGGTFNAPMTLDHAKVKKLDGTVNEGIDISLERGGNPGSDFVVYGIEINDGDDVKMAKGDFLEFTLPPLSGVSLLNDNDTVTIDASVIAVTGNFPGGSGSVSKCLSDRHSGGKPCIYARSMSVASLSLGPTNNGGGQENLSGAIDPDNPDRLVGGGPVVDITVPGGLVGASTSQVITALRVGEVDYEYKFADPINNPVTLENGNICLPNERVEPRVEPIGIRGEIMGFRRGDAINIAVSPEPSENKGFLVMRNMITQGAPIVRMPGGGVFSRELSQTVLASGKWEFFFIPKSGVNLQFADTWTLSAGLDFLHPDFTDIASSPISRTVIIGHQRSGSAQALAYAIPPLSAADGSFIRIRCEFPDTTNTCRISLECSNQSGDESWFGHVQDPIPYHGTTVLNGQDIASILEPSGFDPQSHWGGEYNGRLACEVFVRENSRITLQMLVRSGGILTNNTDVNWDSPVQ
ncbi:hypothetical protein [Thioalkalivibrio sp. HK1]|uniref:hypothetical protein n=1 Tax=Thioalkalivibrio sp. HK1 TaxID=1469245 RepID=UPI0004728571|nr:hypothetical protein [Thioalkalivibrio sp. HK1]